MGYQLFAASFESSWTRPSPAAAGRLYPRASTSAVTEFSVFRWDYLVERPRACVHKPVSIQCESSTQHFHLFPFSVDAGSDSLALSSPTHLSTFSLSARILCIGGPSFRIHFSIGVRSSVAPCRWCRSQI